MNSEESRNLILAIALSALVMVGWFFFFGSKLQPGSGLLAPMASSTQPAATGSGSTPASAATAPQPGAPALDAVAPRETVIGASARVAIDTPALGGSIDLTGGSFDDLILKGYRETIDPKSPNIALFSPAGSPQPYWAETGFVTDAAGVKTPNRTTVWTADAATLTPKQPVTLSWDNGAGLKFSRKIEVDDRYLFTVTDSVENTGAAAVALRPYSLILRRGKPAVSGYAVLHEGFVGVIGDSSVQEITYPNIEKETGRVRALKDLYPDDKQKQQQAQMELFKKEGVNPVAGCLPMAVQIPVFFSLYKVIFITIEMRHAPFFGWIKDLSAPDPTNVFNLFGLLPFDPTQLPVIGHFLALGVWPLVMGVSMFFQMKMNPEPADPVQKQMFAYMPLIFTFMLGTFPAGLVIYWTWNNTLTVIQQSVIMKRAGVKLELFDNLKKMFRKDPPQKVPTK